MTVLTNLVTPVDVTPVYAGNTFVDVDVSAYVTNASGVSLFINTLSGTIDFQVRIKGSTQPDNSNNTVVAMYTNVGIDSNNIFQARSDVGSSIKIWLLGYFDASTCVFLEDPPDINSGVLDAWNDVDISAYLGGDTALAALLTFESFSGGNKLSRVRKPGMTYDMDLGTMGANSSTGGVASGVVDGKVQIYSDTALVHFVLNGYIKSEVTMYDEPTTLTVPGVDSWVQQGNVPAGMFGSFLMQESYAAYYGWRPSERTEWDFVHGKLAVRNNGFFTVTADPSGNIDIYIDRTSSAIKLIGVIDVPPAADAVNYLPLGRLF